MTSRAERGRTVLVHLVPIIGFARVFVALGTFAQWRHDLELDQAGS
jgi:hypothetical protein